MAGDDSKQMMRETSGGVPSNPLKQVFEAAEKDLRRLEQAGIEPWDEGFVSYFSEGLERDEKEWLRGEWIQPWERYAELLSGVHSGAQSRLRPFLVAWEKLQIGASISAAWSLVGLLKPIEEAMKQSDESFFVELLRLAKKLFRETFATHELRLLELAFAMRKEIGRNPTRAEMKTRFLASGIQIDEKDWSGYFKRCRLDFLAKSRPGRRPGKKRGQAK
jgi:hypothetical protein